MTLSVRSSSLHDTTSLQRLGMAGVLAASVLVIGLAVQVSPLVGTPSTADDAAVSNTGYMAAPGVSDPAGEHSGLGAVSNTGYMAAVGISDPAGEHTGWQQVIVDFDDFRGWQQAPSFAEDRNAIDAGRHRPGLFRSEKVPERIGGR